MSLWLLILAAVPAQRSAEYEAIELRGFTVQVQTDLDAEQPGLRKQTLEILDRKLGDLVDALPGTGLKHLRTVTIWVSEGAGPAPCANYHPSADWLRTNGYDPRKAKGVEINNASVFVQWIKGQPAMVLHELAHAYHHQVLTYGHPELLAAHESAVAGHRFDAVRRYGGNIERHYALNSVQEWFAETTEAFFGTNDYFPFVRGQLVHVDRKGSRLVARLWGAPEPPEIPESERMSKRAEKEIVELHRFFHRWFAGELANTDEAFARFGGAMAAGFRLVSPGGETRLREPMLASLRATHGAVVQEVEVDRVEAQPVADGLWLVTYREWQRSPDEPWKGRSSSALLREDPAAPAGFLWLHVHETWLPEGTKRD